MTRQRRAELEARIIANRRRTAEPSERLQHGGRLVSVAEVTSTAARRGPHKPAELTQDLRPTRLRMLPGIVNAGTEAQK